MKKITVKINSLRDYVELLNGIFGLTNSEITIFTEFLRIKLALDKKGSDKNPFSTEMKKRVANKLNRNNFNTLNTYIKRLKDKGAVRPVKDGYKIHHILVPSEDNKIQIKLKQS